MKSELARRVCYLFQAEAEENPIAVTKPKSEPND